MNVDNFGESVLFLFSHICHILEGVELDGDDPAHIKWVYDKASERASQYGISGVTYRLTQGNSSSYLYERMEVTHWFVNHVLAGFAQVLENLESPEI